VVKTGNFVFLGMQYISGISGNQMRISSLEDAFTADNQVRFLDAFGSVIDLPQVYLSCLEPNPQRRLVNCTKSDFRYDHHFETLKTARLSIIN
jgi:hypothetical protein